MAGASGRGWAVFAGDVCGRLGAGAAGVVHGGRRVGDDVLGSAAPPPRVTAATAAAVATPAATPAAVTAPVLAPTNVLDPRQQAERHRPRRRRCEAR